MIVKMRPDVARPLAKRHERWLVSYQLLWTIGLFALSFLGLYLAAGQTLSGAMISHLVSEWDAKWYLTVVSQGYTWNGIATMYQDVAFFPLFPAIVAVFRHVLLNAEVAGVLFSVAFQAAAVVILYRTYCLVASPKTARRLAILYILFPVGIFSLFVYPVSLMSALGFFAVYAYLRGWRLWAFVAAGAATAAGPGMVALTVGLAAYDAIAQPKKALASIPVYLVGFWGIALYTVFLGVTLGAPFAYNTVQVAWHGPVALTTDIFRSLALLPLSNGLLSFVRSPAERPFMYLQDTIVAITFLAGLLYLLWKGSWFPLVTAGAGFIVLMVFNAAPYDVPLSFTRLAYPFLFLLPLGEGVRRFLSRRWASVLPFAFALWSVFWIVIWVKGLWIE